MLIYVNLLNTAASYIATVLVVKLRRRAGRIG